MGFTDDALCGKRHQRKNNENDLPQFELLTGLTFERPRH